MTRGGEGGADGGTIGSTFTGSGPRKDNGGLSRNRRGGKCGDECGFDFGVGGLDAAETAPKKAILGSSTTSSNLGDVAAVDSERTSEWREERPSSEACSAPAPALAPMPSPAGDRTRSGLGFTAFTDEVGDEDADDAPGSRPAGGEITEERNTDHGFTAFNDEDDAADVPGIDGLTAFNNEVGDAGADAPDSRPAASGGTTEERNVDHNGFIVFK